MLSSVERWLTDGLINFKGHPTVNSKNLIKPKGIFVNRIGGNVAGNDRPPVQFSGCYVLK